MKRVVWFLTVCALGLGFSGSPISAATWTEQGDAGQTLATAQALPTGIVPLDQIDGTADGTTGDADVYEIFISDPAAFSAQTVGGDSKCTTCATQEFDASLALFDENGIGIYFNDDLAQDVGDAFLPAGNALSPTQAGWYFLAVFDDDLTPLSELSEEGIIFPEVFFPFTDIVGPTGPGGGDPLSLFFEENVVVETRDYSVLLTGTVIPEPATGLLVGLGFTAMGVVRRGKRGH
jgi:hypothetical protein